MTGVACYVERGGSGSLIRSVRLIGPGLARTWLSPDAATGTGPSTQAAQGDSPDSGGMGGFAAEGPALLATRAAAKWIAETLRTGGHQGLELLCADSDGVVCTWLSTPGTDPAILNATLMQGGIDADGSATSAGGGGGGVGRLLAGISSGGGGVGGLPDVSVQALATPEAGDSGGSGRRRRVAILAVPDATLRVLLDELDSRGIEVRRTISLQHALAQAWDPGAAGGSGGADPHERVVASSTPATAILLVEPTGRLTWAWSSAGNLLAGGTMLLRTLAPEPESEEPDAGGARRMASPAGNGVAGGDEAMWEAPPLVEFSGADAGRLVMDWLGWSAQLGRSPGRMICLGPAEMRGESGPNEGGAGPGAMGAALVRAWPGAMVDLAVHDDPVGVTLGRLLNASGKASSAASGGAGTDPRASLTGLSARPGRADKRMYTWAAAAVLALAGAVGVGGYRMFQAGSSVEAAIAEAREQRTAALVRGEKVIPQLSQRESESIDLLQSELTRIERTSVAIRPPQPLLKESLRVIRALEGVKDIQITTFEFNPIAGSVRFQVPDADTGPQVLERLRASTGKIVWGGSSSTAGGGRVYSLQGLFPARDASAGGEGKP